MTTKPLTVLFVGNTNNYPLLLAEAFRESGLNVRLLVNRKELLHRPESKYPAWKNAYPDWIKDYSNISDEDLFFKTSALEPLIRELKAPADLAILNDTGPAFAHHLSMPHICILTGSDLTFYADYASIEKRSKSWAPEYRRSLKGREALFSLAEFVSAQRDGIASSEVVCYGQRGLIPEGDQILDALGITDERRMMLYLSDTIRLSPKPSNPGERLRVFSGSRIVFDTASNPDFGTIDFKGTDKLIKGYAQYCRLGGQGELRLPRKGPDVESAVRLVKDLDIQNRVVWLDEMSLFDFYQEMSKADLVCDQMGTSFPGMVTTDAYAMAKPVMADFRNDLMTRAFTQPLPGFNVTTSEEVTESLLEVQKNPHLLTRLGSDSRRYAETYLSPSMMAQCLLDKYASFETGRGHKSRFNFKRNLQSPALFLKSAEKVSVSFRAREFISEEDVQTLWRHPRLLSFFIRLLRVLKKAPGTAFVRSLIHETREFGVLGTLRVIKRTLVRYVQRCQWYLIGLSSLNYAFDRDWPALDKFPQACPVSNAAVSGKPSVCLVTVNLSAGGAERQVACLAVELKKRGYSVRVRVLRLSAENGHYLELLKRNGVDVEVPRFPARSGIQLMKARGVDFELYRHLPEELRVEALSLTHDLISKPVDIVHCYLDWSCCYGGFAALMSGIPKIRFSWRNVTPVHFEFNRVWMFDLYKLFLPLFGTRVIIENNTVNGAKDYERWLGMPADSVTVIPNGLDTTSYDEIRQAGKNLLRTKMAARFGFDPADPVLVSVGRLSAEKRPFDLLEVLVCLRRQFPRIRLLHAGAGVMDSRVRAKAVEMKLIDSAVSNKCSSSFYMLGNRDDIPELLLAADVFVFTSEFEGMPNVVMEAMYAGLPVVSTDVGGIPGLIQNGFHGYLHRVGDSEGMASSVESLLRDPESAKTMGERGRETIQRDFTIRVLADRVISAYRQQMQPLSAECGA